MPDVAEARALLALMLLRDARLDEPLAGYHLLPAARADLLRRLARWREAAAYAQAAR